MLKRKLIVTCLATTMLVSCATSTEINQQSETQYAQILTQARQKGVLDTSSITSKRVHKIFRVMQPYAERENNTGTKFNWQIAVVKNTELNAWAMPGGKMMFYTGLVDKLALTDDEIATVMGHEMAHALKEHGKSSRNFGVFTAVLGTAVELGASAALGVDLQGLGSGTVDLITNKPYSRSHETEADEVGIMLMAKSGYNPQAAPKLWQKMQAQGGSSKVASLFSTHPSDEERQANLQRLLPQAMEVYKQKK
ncbi:M48 family metallopeptidase [Lonepinella sp. BR2474]|uniref:M48 family metallopeptidase n=1 Tax=Lonepinella sp. BR2474 TaxID=3434548 RepID=UPI003F6E0299